jgi:hypothetical protein
MFPPLGVASTPTHVAMWAMYGLLRVPSPPISEMFTW